MIFVDSNIPMYLVGADHPNRTAARIAVERAILDRESLVTDAEAYQEILHRYAAIRRFDAIGPAFETLDALVDEVLPVTHEDVRAAREVLLGAAGGSARDALHVAIMRRAGCDRIISFDRALEDVPGITRLG